MLLAYALLAPAQTASWLVREAPPGTASRAPWAVVSNEGGDELTLFRDDDGQVTLEFRAGGAVSGLSRSSCPTFQIDDRAPLHHLPIATACRVELERALLDVGRIRGRALTSTVVQRLMNGGNVTFRYMTADGAYHEANFTLVRSADTIRRALGRDVRVRAE